MSYVDGEAMISVQGNMVQEQDEQWKKESHLQALKLKPSLHTNSSVQIREPGEFHWMDEIYQVEWS